MKYLLIILITLGSFASQAPQKVVLSDDVLDRLNELEVVYKTYLKAGMTSKDASNATMHWQDTRYPILLAQLKKKSDKKTKEK